MPIFLHHLAAGGLSPDPMTTGGTHCHLSDAFGTDKFSLLVQKLSHD